MTEQHSLIVPSGTPGLNVVTLDLTRVREAEALLPDIAMTTTAKAPYLLAVFNEAFNDLIGTIRISELEALRAKSTVNQIRSRIILDEVKDVLKNKGLSKDNNPAGSEDLRRAVLEANQEYIEAMDRMNFLEVTTEFLRGKLKSMDMAYTAVKKIISDQQTGSYHRATDTNGTLSDEVPVGGVQPKNGFVKPRL
jgi:hypothetical protein